MSQNLIAVQTTKKEFLANDLPDDTKIIYLIIDSENVKLADMKEQTSSEKKKKLKRKLPQSDKISDLEKNEDVKKQRKSKVYLLYQRCCSKTSKNRCKYAHLVADYDLKTILDNLYQKNNKQLLCKRHKNSPIKDEYVKESIQAILAPSEVNEEIDVKLDDIPNEIGEVDLNIEIEESSKVNKDSKVNKSNSTQTSVTVDILDDDGSMYDNGEEKDWTEIVNDLLNAVKNGTFVIGKDSDGESSLPHINTDSDQHFHLIAWNHKRNCGIIYVIETQTFWYSFINSDGNNDGHKITQTEHVDLLKKYVNTES